ncbi:homeobox protein dve-1 isoform X2 [Maniola jurtina]|uniref:homeobox protein dve-1 isoform X2 n=1 Tax=Maniola jurtina TaxID=191418 RepID=UPI001E6877E4|nr:homeobox protein dve-1 isoform X2 [Maniola jurtina]
MDFQSAMETFAEAWAAANTAKSEAPSDLSQTLATELRRSKTPPRRSPEERALPRPPSAPAHHDRLPHTPHAPHTPHTPHTPHLSPKKEAFNNLLNKSISGKTLPVHCVVEAVASIEEGAWRRRAVVETDSYVIIPAATAFHELVPAAMMRLGYPHELAASAKGSVVINNWKPLPFERISDGPLATVGEVLGELTTVATLRIQLLRPRLTPLQDIKDKLLRLLLVQSRPLLMSTGCPLDEVTLAQICRGQDRTPGPHNFHEPTEETRRKFESWWSAQVSPRPPPPFSPRRYPSPSPKNRSPTLNPLPDHLHPALQTVQSQYPTQKTRMRTSFDPELELPKLQRWFSENQHPSRQQIQQYVRELNNLESRRGRKPLDVNNVVYWFKNARAAQKRAELRNIGGLGAHLGVNGFNSRSHSPTNGSLLAGNDNYNSHDHHSMKSPMQLSGSPGRYPMSVMSEDNLSNAGSDLEDDGGDINPDDRPESPDAPLSLITTRKNNNEQERDENVKESPKPPDIIKVHDIKQEPRDLTKSEQMPSPHRSPAKNSDSSHNNNNNNTEEENGGGDDHDIPSDDEMVQERHYRPSSPHLDRLPFPMVPNHPMFGHGIMYMSQYMSAFPGVGPVPGEGASGLNLALAGASDERRKRNRTFIDPVSEVPVLEQWFSMNTHPSHNLILKYTEELNRMPYRQKFPRLESKNVQFWFKNRRAKCKRLKMSLYEPTSPGHYSHPGHPHAIERKMV